MDAKTAPSVLLFFLDLPVDQEGQRTAKEDDRAKNDELIPLADDNGSKDLAAELELKGKCDALRQIKANVVFAADPADEAFDNGNNENGNTRQLGQEDRVIDDRLKYLINN